MKRLEYLRREKNLSQKALGELCNPHIDASKICNAEIRGLILTDALAKRLAFALGWEGEPSALFEDVGTDAETRTMGSAIPDSLERIANALERIADTLSRDGDAQ